MDKYVILNINENWNAVMAKMVLENVITKEKETFECSLDAIDKIAKYLSHQANEEPAASWLIGRTIDLDLFRLGCAFHSLK